jgi:hypothetical protein
MKYLVRKRVKNRRVAHLWNDTDTLCRMHSTGGIREDKYEIIDELGDLPICTMCKNVYESKRGR